MNLSPRFLAFVRPLLSLAVITVVSCSGGPPLNPPTGLIGGISAPKSKLIVQRDQTFRYGNMVYDFPAGEYRPAYEDANGVYYEAPQPIQMRENLFGANLSKDLVIGGIYVERANPKVAYIYNVGRTDRGGEIQRALYGGRPLIIGRKPRAVEFTLARL